MVFICKVDETPLDLSQGDIQEPKPIWSVSESDQEDSNQAHGEIPQSPRHSASGDESSDTSVFDISQKSQPGRVVSPRDIEFRELLKYVTEN